jgi:hypothetical protein
MRAMVKARSMMAVVALAAAGCSGMPLGGGTGGNKGAGGDVSPCTTYTGCGIGTGGSSGGGDTGTGASGGADAGDSGLCNQLDLDYNAAVAAALACTPGAPNQCQALVASIPTSCPDLACGSQSYVNDGTSVETERVYWLDMGCGGPPHSCPAIACSPSAPPATCVADGPDATTGTCVPYASDAGTGIAPDGGESCDQLATDYAAAVTAALACTPGAPNQCQSYVTSTVANSPDPSNCQPITVVNDPTNLDAALQRWSAQCLTGGAILLVKCDPPTQRASCVPNVDAGVLSASAGACVPSISD